MFKSRYTPGPTSGYNPKTGAQSQMRTSTAGGPAGSMQNAAAQIRQAPQPFQNPQGAIRGVPTITAAQRTQPHGSPAKGTTPRHHTAAAPRSAPMSDAAIRSGAGYKKPVNYANHAVHTAKNQTVRVMRGAIPGSKPLVPSMTDDDFAKVSADTQRYRIL